MKRYFRVFFPEFGYVTNSEDPDEEYSNDIYRARVFNADDHKMMLQHPDTFSEYNVKIKWLSESEQLEMNGATELLIDTRTHRSPLIAAPIYRPASTFISGRHPAPIHNALPEPKRIENRSSGHRNAGGLSKVRTTLSMSARRGITA